MNGQDKRAHQRGAHFHIAAKISRDRKRWKEAEIDNLSSGGLQLHTDDIFNPGDTLWFDLHIQGFFSEIQIKVQGLIRRKEVKDQRHVYGVSFNGLSQDLGIFIDENIQNDRPIGGSPYLLDD